MLTTNLFYFDKIMNEFKHYNNDLITQVFPNLSIDKKRLPSSGLTESGVPSFVALWVLYRVGKFLNFN